MDETKTYDVAILGSGPGGYVAAIRAGQLGLKTVVVEKHELFGGTCLHVGCIPTKALLYTAELLDKIREAETFGIVVENPRLDWAALQKRKARVVHKLALGINGLFKKNKVEAVRGFGALVAPGTIQVRREGTVTTVSAENVILATGSEPRSLPGLTIDGHTVLTNDEILALASQPRSLAVIGAGAVGAEFASIFASFGTEVTLIEILPRVLPLEDEEVSEALARAFRKRRIRCLTSTKVESVKLLGDEVELICKDTSGNTMQLAAEKLLVAVGRKPRTEGIGLEEVGVQTERGFVKVDGFMQTSVPGVYAVGDITTSPQLAHVASAEGIVAVEKIAGVAVQPLNYNHMPSATYCSPEVASVGLTEARARELGHEVRVGRFPFAASSKASILGENEGLVKIVAEARYDELLGVHIIGPHATDLIAEACVALSLEATAEALMRTVHAHPTLSESIMEAAHGVGGHPIHA